MKLGIIREGKTPPDKRVPLTPQQCKELQEQYSDLEILVQPSPIRAFTDAEYAAQGLELREDLSDCDVLMGVKEVPLDMLMEGKTYMFFSHTYKKQPYNRKLLKAIIDKNIRLIDYEVLTNARGTRIIGFGRYAGVVGMYNGLLAFGKKHNIYDLKPAHQCADRKEMEAELAKVELPNNFKLAITGAGRVAGGALEIIEQVNLERVSADDFANKEYTNPVFTQLLVDDYNEPLDGKPFERKDFYNDPVDYRSTFMQYAKEAHMYVSCHYWDSKSPFIFTREDAKSEDFNISVVADISCDIDGPVASTLRPSTIESPLYGYDPDAEIEVPFGADNAIGVMAVDNLPCELPKDASEDFGNELIKNVIPHFFNGDKEEVLERATETRDGKLTPQFSFLQNYLDGKE